MLNARQRITVQLIQVLVDHDDRDGFLVLADGKVVALFVRLDGEEHGDDQGKWYLEVGFGRCANQEGTTLSSMDDVLAWATGRVAAFGPNDAHRPLI